jgi:fructose-bisphosphate aldolase class II
MGHNIKPGVATGIKYRKFFNYAKELCTVNVTGSSTINGVLETAAN